MKATRPRRRTAPADAQPTERQRSQAGALARLGLEAGKQVRHELLRRLHAGDVKYARKLTHSRTVVVLDYAGGEIAFLYSTSTKEILSFLAPNAPETEDWRCSQAAARALFGARREPGEAAS